MPKPDKVACCQACGMVLKGFLKTYAWLLVTSGLLFAVLSDVASCESLGMLAIAKEKMGRIFSVMGFVSSGMNALLMALSGLLLDMLGYKMAVSVFLGIMMIVFIGVLSAPVIRNRPVACEYDEFAQKVGWK